MKLRNPFKTAPRLDPATPSWATYMDALVPDTEATIARWRDVTTAREIAKRIHGPALGCALINARVCSSVPIRLYRVDNAAPKSWRQYGAKEVTGVDRKRYLTDPKRVGRKASMLAQQDDGMVEVVDHPVLSLLQKPNPEVTGTEFEFRRWLDKWLFGNSLSLKLRNGREVVGLASLMPEFVRVQPSTATLISAYYFGRDNADMETFDAEDVVHQRFAPHWRSPYWGMSPMDIVFRELDLYEYSLAAEQARWKHGGYPSGVLSMKNVRDQKTLDQIAKSVDRRHAGADKSGKLLVTSEGTYTPLGKTQEMGYIPGMEHIERRIEQEYGVPEALRRLNDANLASGQMGPDIYYLFTVQPNLAIDAEQLTELLLPEFGIDPGEAWLAYDDVVPQDLEALRQDTLVHVTGGVLTIDEQRARLGYEGAPGGIGAKHRINGIAIEPERVVVAPAPPPVQSPPTPAPTEEPEPEPSAPEPTPEAAAKAAPTIATKADDGLTIGELDKVGARVRDELEADLRAWYARVADGMRVRPDGTVDLSAFDAELLRILTPYLTDLVSAGAAMEADGETPVRLTNERAAELARQRGTLLVEQIRGTTEDRIRDAVARGVEEGRPLNEVITDLREDGSAQAGANAERIARTETAYAVTAGKRSQWREAGITQVRWVLAPGACPVCEAIMARNGGVVGIDEPFAHAGETLGDYTTKVDIWGPPAHPNDRCGIAAVTSEGNQ